MKGQDQAKQSRIAAKKVAEEVNCILQNPPEVGHTDKILFQNATVTSMPARYQKAWIQQVKTATTKEQLRQRRERADTNQQSRLTMLREVTEAGLRINARK